MNIKQSSAALKAVDGFLKSRGVHLGAVSTLELVELMVVALATQPPQDERGQVYAKCWVCRMPMNGTSEDDCHCFHRRELAASAPAQPVMADGVTNALRRLECAVDHHLGRSAWTQTKHLKGFGYSEQVRKELYAAHDAARAALSGTGSDESKGTK